MLLSQSVNGLLVTSSHSYILIPGSDFFIRFRLESQQDLADLHKSFFLIQAPAIDNRADFISEYNLNITSAFFDALLDCVQRIDQVICLLYAEKANLLNDHSRKSKALPLVSSSTNT